MTHVTYFWVPDDASRRASRDFTAFVESHLGKAHVLSLSGGCYLVSVESLPASFARFETAGASASGRRGFHLVYSIDHASAWRYSESIDQFRARIGR